MKLILLNDNNKEVLNVTVFVDVGNSDTGYNLQRTDDVMSLLNTLIENISEPK